MAFGQRKMSGQRRSRSVSSISTPLRRLTLSET
jgi:hypothetical protein